MLGAMGTEKLLVVKFGGSVLEDGESIRRAAEAVRRERLRNRGVVVVVSAMKGTTDRLLETARKISQSPAPEMVDYILALGEEESARIMTAALRSIGLDAVEVTPDSPSWPIVTEEEHGCAEPLLEECRNQVELGLKPLIERGKVPVVCGFIGKSPSGRATTLGRGGSDITAVLLARLLGAEELVLVKDVGGIYSADPHRVGDAKLIEDLEAEEAYLLASAGAKVLHSKVFKYKPEGLKVRVTSNSGRLEEGGTLIHGEVPDLQVVSYDRPVLLVTVVGDGLSNQRALAEMTEEIVGRGMKVLSLRADDRAVNLIIDGEPSEVLEAVHRVACSENLLKGLSALEDLALITVKGRRLEALPEAIQRIAEPLAKRGIKIYESLTIHNSVSLLIRWGRREEALRLIRETLGCV
ncbi:aspartate kinase [Candidatus Bathyarchaeota archaeon]|nr:MAG: aspartate kinase [Candidatus Bathyarchaeota archaeon]